MCEGQQNCYYWISFFIEVLILDIAVTGIHLIRGKDPLFLSWEGLEKNTDLSVMQSTQGRRGIRLIIIYIPHCLYPAPSPIPTPPRILCILQRAVAVIVGHEGWPLILRYR